MHSFRVACLSLSRLLFLHSQLLLMLQQLLLPLPLPLLPLLPLLVLLLIPCWSLFLFLMPVIRSFVPSTS